MRRKVQYLDIVQRGESYKTQMKEMIIKQNFQWVKTVLRSKLSSRNVLQVINTWKTATFQ